MKDNSNCSNNYGSASLISGAHRFRMDTITLPDFIWRVTNEETLATINYYDLHNIIIYE